MLAGLKVFVAQHGSNRKAGQQQAAQQRSRKAQQEIGIDADRHVLAVLPTSMLI
jgi:hypothetical protein